MGDGLVVGLGNLLVELQVDVGLSILVGYLGEQVWTHTHTTL